MCSKYKLLKKTKKTYKSYLSLNQPISIFFKKKDLKKEEKLSKTKQCDIMYPAIFAFLQIL